MKLDVVAFHIVTDTWHLKTDHLKEPSHIGRFEETSESSMTPIRSRNDVPNVLTRVQRFQIRKLYLLCIVSLSDKRSITVAMLLN